MLPITLNPHFAKAGLIGAGDALQRRAALLADAGVEARLLPPDAPDAVLQGLNLLFVAGLPEGESRDLANRARALGLLVNVEDVLPLCDFHVPAIVRRGDLLLTASTGGQVPGLSRALRESLAEQFGPEWTVRLRDLGLARARWRAEGLSPGEVSAMVRAKVESEGWL
jgi:precorrin-2 dehydrogenase/sirohydrochlorin ferrochelatase